MSKNLKNKILEHNFEHVFKLKKKYSIPRIFDGKGDLSKRWYVYFSFRNPVTDKLERLPNIYVSNTLDKSERIKLLKQIQKNLSEMLKEGFNPFSDGPTESTNKNMDIENAFKFVLEIKKNTTAATSYSGFKSNINSFEKWLIKNGFNKRFVSSINKKVVTTYLNELSKDKSSRTRNNIRISISTLFQVLEDNEIIEKNFIKSIPILKANPQKNKTYTLKQENDLFEYMVQNDKQLMLFVQFVSFNFLRPIEVCRLKVSDISLEDKTLYVKAKNKAVKLKIIPDIMIKELEFLKDCNQDHYIFTSKGVDYSTVSDEDRRDYFSKRFKKVKDKFGLGKDYGLYSFRHTFITKLYSELVKNSTPNEAKSKLMIITGHNTMNALEQYLRDIDAVRPDDYSKYLE
jgi:integrase